MSNISAIIQEYLDLIDEDRADAFFGLLEMDHEIIPDLIAAFREARDVQVRDLLVEVIWQHRQPSTIPFLAEALHDDEPPVWRQALDGLVTLASPAALDVMRSARNRQFKHQRQTEEFRRWLDEAIEQAEEVVKGKEQ